jgi:hypothetical protein
MFAKGVLRSFLLAALCVSLSLPLLPQVPAVQSNEASPDVRIDGQTGDWTASQLVLDAGSGTEFAFQNNGRELYILLVLKKPEARVSLESTGMTVLARTEGTKTSRGVLFLKRTVPAETFILWQESQGTLMTEGEKTKLRGAVQHDLYLAFAVGERGSTYGPLRRLPESNPPEFGVSEEAAGTIYELKIPLVAADLVPGGVGASPGDNVRISFEWGGAARKILSTKSTREATPMEKRGDLSGSGRTWAQEFLDTFDSLSRPTMGTKKFSFAVDVTLAEAK